MSDRCRCGTRRATAVAESRPVSAGIQIRGHGRRVVTWLRRRLRVVLGMALVSTSRLKPRVPLYKGQTASRRSVENGKGLRPLTTLPYSFEPRSLLFGSHLARSQAGTASARGCYRSRRLLLPYASRRNAPTRAG